MNEENDMPIKDGKINRKICSVMCMALVLIIVAQLLGISLKNRVLYKNCAPQETNYQSFDPYCLYIIERRRLLDSRVFLRVINQNQGPSGYGFEMNYFSDYFNDFVNGEELKRAKVIWEEDGISLSIPVSTYVKEAPVFLNQYRLFIPKESFIGGR